MWPMDMAMIQCETLRLTALDARQSGVQRDALTELRPALAQEKPAMVD